ncbi:MAG: hypothetical protein Q7S54_00265 [bacterium]|nr:hypothetical protein [bacterium]
MSFSKSVEKKFFLFVFLAIMSGLFLVPHRAEAATTLFPRPIAGPGTSVAETRSNEVRFFVDFLGGGDENYCEFIEADSFLETPGQIRTARIISGPFTDTSWALSPDPLGRTGSCNAEATADYGNQERSSGESAWQNTSSLAPGTYRVTIEVTNDLNDSGNDYVDFTVTGSPSGPVYGCTDPSATNFNSLATVDDGSCTYGSGEPPPPPPPPPPGNYTLTTSVTGSGVITGLGINCPGDCSETYTSGAWGTILATPSSGYSFSSWSGSCAGQGSSCSLYFDGNKATTANFVVSGGGNPPGGGLSVTIMCNNTYGPCVVEAGSTGLVTWTSTYDRCWIITSGDNQNSEGDPTGHLWWSPINQSTTFTARCFQLQGGQEESKSVDFVVNAPPPPPPVSQCANGIDDDGDGKTDYPLDPGCSNNSDGSETDAPPPPPPPESPVDVTCAGLPIAARLGETVTWTADVSGGEAPYTYSWSGIAVPINPAPNTNPFRISYSTIGDKSVTLTVTDSENNVSTCTASNAGNGLGVKVYFEPYFEEF